MLNSSEITFDYRRFEKSSFFIITGLYLLIT